MVHSLPHLPIQELIALGSSEEYKKTCKSFLGSPRKHPSDPQRIILVTQVLEKQRVFLEFKKSDICHVDEAQTVTTEEGESINLVTLWLAKESIGIELRPFKV